jgi:uncharacterized integral membrane protein
MTEPPDRPLPPDETAAPRRFTARHFITAALLAFAVVYLVLLIVENRRIVHVDYVFGSGDHRLIWLIVVSGFLGWLLGLATSYQFRRRRRRGR